MTVDRSRLFVRAVGNHRAGYAGSLMIDGAGPRWEWTCRHAHSTTAEARDCARRAIRTALDRRQDDG